MDNLGTYLRTRRKEAGLTIEDVAGETNIAKRYLTALEEEDFDQLPAEVYTRGFLRTYARLLELNPEEIIEAYEESKPEEAKQEQEEDKSGGGLPILLLYWGSMILVLGLAVVVILLRFGWVSPERADQIHEQLSGEIQAVNMEEPDELVIEVKAIEQTWLLITYDGFERRQQMLHPDQTVTWRAEETLLLRLGNAGGLRLFHRGEELPSLGESGEVVDVVINLKDGEAEVRPLNQRDE